jgi:hypothetical protein
MPDETNPPPNERTTGQGANPRRSSFRPAPADVGAKATEDKQADEANRDKVLADEGHPDALAQIKLARVAGPAGLLTAINGLPAIPALDGLRANYEHYTNDELVDALKTLPLPEDNKGALEHRDEIVRKLEAGEFRR